MKIKRNVSALAAVLSVILLLAGCQTTGIHSGKEVLGASQEYVREQLTVKVVSFNEKRSDTNRYGTVYRYLIPLALYGTISYERPESGETFNTPEEAFLFGKTSMTETLARAVFNKLGKEKLFSSVVFSSQAESADTDLILTGDVNSTLYEGKTYSYGVSFLGPALWCLGLPAGSTRNSLDMTLYLKKRDTDEVIWKYKINKETAAVQGLYYNRKKSVNNYVKLVREGMDEAIKDLKEKLARMPLEKLKAAPAELKPKPELVPGPKVESKAEFIPKPILQVAPESKPKAIVESKQVLENPPAPIAIDTPIKKEKEKPQSIEDISQPRKELKDSSTKSVLLKIGTEEDKEE